MNENNVNLRINRLFEIIHSDMIKDFARLAGDMSRWTRQRKMPLHDMLICTLGKKGLTTAMEIRNFYTHAEKIELAVSKQDYLRQRQFLNPEVFSVLNQSYLSPFYQGTEPIEWQGYVVLGTDGSKIEIPNSKENRDTYGHSKNQHGETSARANCSILHDLFNGFMIDIGLHEYQGSEITEAKAHIKTIREIIGERPVLIIFDRNYVSLEFIDILEKAGIHYLMRLQAGTYKKEVSQLQSSDEEVEVKHTADRMSNLRRDAPEREKELSKRPSTRIRMIKTTFKDEEHGILITNLSKESSEEIQQLYRKRWKIEEQYHTMKNKMKFESVTGNASIYVKQDFLAQMLVFNIIRDLITKAESRAVQQKRKKPLKYEIRVNENIAIGLFKDQFIKLMLENDDYRKDVMLSNLLSEIEKHILPVRPGQKSTPRKWNKSNKYKCNLKPAF